MQSNTVILHSGSVYTTILNNPGLLLSKRQGSLQCREASEDSMSLAEVAGDAPGTADWLFAGRG